MASLPDETLRRILEQIQRTAKESQRARQISEQQIAVKERECRILQLTIVEIASLEKDVNVYKGVGRIFMRVPRSIMEMNLNAEKKRLTTEITALEKKSKYLEKQGADAQAQLRDIFHSAPDQS